MAAIEPVQLRTHFVFRTGADGVARRAFVESVLAFLDILCCGFLQHRWIGNHGDNCGGRKKRSFHSIFPI